MPSKPDPFLEKMITQERAARVTKRLFPDEVPDPQLRCSGEPDGSPCRICEAAHVEWMARIAQVRAAMMEAFR